MEKNEYVHDAWQKVGCCHLQVHWGGRITDIRFPEVRRTAGLFPQSESDYSWFGYSKDRYDWSQISRMQLAGALRWRDHRDSPSWGLSCHGILMFADAIVII